MIRFGAVLTVVLVAMGLLARGGSDQQPAAGLSGHWRGRAVRRNARRRLGDLAGRHLRRGVGPARRLAGRPRGRNRWSGWDLRCGRHGPGSGGPDAGQPDGGVRGHSDSPRCSSGAGSRRSAAMTRLFRRLPCRHGGICPSRRTCASVSAGASLSAGRSQSACPSRSAGPCLSAGRSRSACPSRSAGPCPSAAGPERCPSRSAGRSRSACPSRSAGPRPMTRPSRNACPSPMCCPRRSACLSHVGCPSPSGGPSPSACPIPSGGPMPERRSESERLQEPERRVRA